MAVEEPRTCVVSTARGRCRPASTLVEDGPAAGLEPERTVGRFCDLAHIAVESAFSFGGTKVLPTSTVVHRQIWTIARHAVQPSPDAALAVSVQGICRGCSHSGAGGVLRPGCTVENAQSTATPHEPHPPLAVTRDARHVIGV